jgi:hypothetical protein
MTLDDDSAIVMLPPSQPGMRVPRHPYPMAPGILEVADHRRLALLWQILLTLPYARDAMSGIKQMNGTQPQMLQHVASVYKELLDGLRSMKQQQWTITNYAILLLAGVFAVAARGLNVPHLSSKLNLLAAAIPILGTGLLIRIQYNMARSRARLDKMDGIYFTDQELESTGLTNEEIDGIRKQTCHRRIGHFLEGWEFTLVLLGVLWGGWLLVYWAL